MNVLMCFWHVLDNLRKNKAKMNIDKKTYEELKKDMNNIHNATSKEEYDLLRKKFSKRYKNKHPKLFEYVFKQWLSGRFSKWQIFRNSYGFANTNSNIEYFNAVFKKFHTNRRRLSIYECIETIGRVIGYYSSLKGRKDFKMYPKFRAEHKRNADKISKKSFHKINKHLYTYSGDNRDYNKNLNDTFSYNKASCNCKTFFSYIL